MSHVRRSVAMRNPPRRSGRPISTTSNYTPPAAPATQPRTGRLQVAPLRQRLQRPGQPVARAGGRRGAWTQAAPVEAHPAPCCALGARRWCTSSPAPRLASVTASRLLCRRWPANQPAFRTAHAGYCRSVGAHLELEQLGLRHKAYRNASGSKATRATDAVQIRGVVAGQVHVDDQVDKREVEASSVEVRRNQDPQPKCARLCK